MTDLKAAVFTVLEGWALPLDARKILETAYYAQPEQMLVCDKDPFYCLSIRCQAGKVCKHTAPPRKGWVGLTDMDIHVLKMNHDKVKVVHTDRAEDLTVLGQDVDVNGLINAIQTKLKELNT